MSMYRIGGEVRYFMDGDVTWCRCGRHLLEPYQPLCPTCADKASVYAQMRRHDRMQSDCRGQR